MLVRMKGMTVCMKEIKVCMKETWEHMKETLERMKVKTENILVNFCKMVTKFRISGLRENKLRIHLRTLAVGWMVYRWVWKDRTQGVRENTDFPLHLWDYKLEKTRRW